jgi:RimJ/RimL family protein N-acetyltransferase
MITGEDEGVEPVELTDDRLRLRPWRLEDAPEVYRACQDPLIQQWTTVPSPYAQSDAEAFVGPVAADGWATGEVASFGIFDRGTGRLLGSIALMHLTQLDVPAGGRAEIGYWCAPWARGRGVMTDAARLLCRWGFDQLGLARIDWYAQVGNHASRRVAEKLGFTVEGLLRQWLVHRGERQDCWVGGLLRGELRAPGAG